MKIIGSVIGCIAWVLLYLVPNLRESTKIEKEHLRLRTEFEQLSAQIQSAIGIFEQRQKVKRQLNKIYTALPPASRLQGMKKMISEMAQNHQVEIDIADVPFEEIYALYLAGATNKEQPMHPLSVKLEGSGSFFGIGQFLEELEQDNCYREGATLYIMHHEGKRLEFRANMTLMFREGS